MRHLLRLQRGAMPDPHISPERKRRNYGSKFSNFAWSEICTVWDSGLCPGCAGTVLFRRKMRTEAGNSVAEFSNKI
jgi:hypothetical protein